MDSLDGDSVVDNADTNKNVSTNPLTTRSFANTFASLHLSYSFQNIFISLLFANSFSVNLLSF